jgi:cell division protein FtsQ
MKRPEGFDPTPPAPAEAKRQPKQGLNPNRKPSHPPARKPTAQRVGGAAKPEWTEAKAEPKPAEPMPAGSKLAGSKLAALRIPGLKGQGQKPAAPKPAGSKPATQKPAIQKPAREQAQKSAAREARKAARARRRYERDEVRRFTRRSRHRRAAWIGAISVTAALIGTVAVAVYSPVLALSRIEITGTASLDKAVILDAVDGQLGTPLALVDTDRLTRELARFTLIQSYVTETVPPSTLIIHITERQAIGSVMTGSGFTVVDPAGVVIQKSDVRPEGIPTIELSGADTDSDVFASVVEVLLALPDPVATQVDRVTAATKDDVTLVLAGSGQRVVWGSAEQSELKARVLDRLMATQDPNAPVEFDVTAPLSVVIRPVG